MGSLFTINFEVLSYKGVGRVGLTVEFNFVFAVKADTGTRPTVAQHRIIAAVQSTTVMTWVPYSRSDPQVNRPYVLGRMSRHAVKLSKSGVSHHSTIWSQLSPPMDPAGCVAFGPGEAYA